MIRVPTPTDTGIDDRDNTIYDDELEEDGRGDGGRSGGHRTTALYSTNGGGGGNDDDHGRYLPRREKNASSPLGDNNHLGGAADATASGKSRNNNFVAPRPGHREGPTAAGRDGVRISGGGLASSTGSFGAAAAAAAAVRRRVEVRTPAEEEAVRKVSEVKIVVCPYPPLCLFLSLFLSLLGRACPRARVLLRFWFYLPYRVCALEQ